MKRIQVGKVGLFLAGTVLTLSAAAHSVFVKPSGRFLAVPVKNGAPKVRVDVYDGEKCIAYDVVEWATESADWIGSLDLGEPSGRTLEFRFSDLDADKVTEASLIFSDTRFRAGDGQLEEPLRPQLHFTPPSGWCNDPNGLSWYKGEWHLFYQHNPFGVTWGNMHWGHAVSKDLLHWRDLGDALAPDERGTMYSGSAATDWSNAAGFGEGAHLLVYTAAAAGNPRTQGLAGSVDGRTYRKLPVPVLSARVDANRDPKLFYHAPSGRWVMLVYGVVERGRHGLSFFVSSNCRDWEKTSHVVGDVIGEGGYLFECPDFFELPIEGEEGSRWILTGANRFYAIGSFDGRKFTPEAERLSCVSQIGNGRSVYAGQTFSDVPDGRRIQMAWFLLKTRGGVAGRIDKKPYMFNQGMTLPSELKLVRTTQGLRLARFPVRELETLRDGSAVEFDAFDGELAEVEFSCRPSADARITLNLRGVKIEYSAPRGVLSVNGEATAWNLDAEGRLGLRIFVDRLGLEIFALDGLQYAPVADVAPDPSLRCISLSSDGTKTPMREVSAKAWRLKSVWQECK